MALSADKSNHVTQPRTTRSFRIANAIQNYMGSFAAIRGETFTTSAQRGYGAPFTAAAGAIPLGSHWNIGTLGDTSASPVKEDDVDTQGAVYRAVTVTGVSAISDVGKVVYWTDDATWSLTRPAIGIPIGVITKWYSSTTADVMTFSFTELCVMALAGSGKQIWTMPTISLSDIASGVGSATDALTNFVAPFHGKITDWYALVTQVGTTSGTYTLTLDIGSTQVTGGSLDISSATTLGAKFTPTSGITALNTFHEGDTITIGQLTTLTDGVCEVGVFMEVEPQIGL